MPPILTGLNAAADPFLQPLAVAAAEREARAVLEEHHVLAVEPRLQLADLLDVDDVAAMDADEHLWGELRFHRVHRLADQVRVVADVELDVVAGSLDPVDFAGADEEDPAARLDDEAIGLGLGRPQVADNGGEAPLDLAVAVAIDLLAGARQRLAEALAVERLQQVVERVHVEGAQRVAVVGGDEDHERHLVDAHRLDDVEAVGAGHLHVEENEVGLQRENRFGAGGAVAGLADQFETGFFLEERAEPLAGEGLVVDDQDTSTRCGHDAHATRNAAGAPAAVTRWKGISIRTESPPLRSENSRR